jgi:hypothetical protein
MPRTSSRSEGGHTRADGIHCVGDVPSDGERRLVGHRRDRPTHMTGKRDLFRNALAGAGGWVRGSQEQRGLSLHGIRG